MTDKVPVTPADRDAAENYLRSLHEEWHSGIEGYWRGERIAVGEVDDDPLVQSFARHRIASEQSRTEEPRPYGAEALYMARSWINQHSLHCRSLVAPESEDGPPFDCDCDLPRKLAVIDAGIAALSRSTQEQPHDTSELVKQCRGGTGKMPLMSDVATTIEQQSAEIARLRRWIRRDAARFDHCATMIAQGFHISGTLRAEHAMKADHYALEARTALQSKESGQ